MVTPKYGLDTTQVSCGNKIWWHWWTAGVSSCKCCSSKVPRKSNRSWDKSNSSKGFVWQQLGPIQWLGWVYLINRNWQQCTGSHVWKWFVLEWLCLPSPYRRLSAEWKLKIDLWGEVLGLHFGQIEGQHTWRCKCTSINSEPCGWIIIVGKQQSSPNFDDPVSTVSYFEATSQFKVLASVSLLALCQKTRTHCLTILYFKEIEPIILKACKIGSSQYVCDLHHKQCVIHISHKHVCVWFT